MDMITGAIVVGALRNYAIHSKMKETYRIAVSSAEKIAKAEVELERHEQETTKELDKLFTRMSGIVSYLEGPFLDVFKPFEGGESNLRAALIEDLTGTDAAENLKLIGSLHTSLCQRPQIEKMAGGRRISGSTSTAAYILFGNLGVASKFLEAARVQHQKANLIATHLESFCTMLDLQKERYYRVNQTLGALNVALITSTAKTKNGMGKLEWMLDGNGHLPPDVTAAEIKTYLDRTDMDQLAICTNIARCIYAIMSEPLFDDQSELTRRAQSLLEEGQAALDKIRKIENHV